jgi:hypothetical protein
MDAVSEILLDRTRETDKVALAVVLSLAAHALLLTAVTYLPHRWDTPKAETHVMTISLGGPEGPVQGRNPIAAKAIQQAVPETVKPKNDAPPVLTKPELSEAVKTARVEPKAVVKPEVRKPEPQLHGRTPTQGTQVNQSIARIETHGAAFAGAAPRGPTSRISAAPSTSRPWCG